MRTPLAGIVCEVWSAKKDQLTCNEIYLVYTKLQKFNFSSRSFRTEDEL